MVALWRASTAVTQEPPVQATTAVVDRLRALHPFARPQDDGLLSNLRDIGAAAAPCVTSDMIRKAVSDFSPTSGAGALGLRPGHLQQAVQLATGDQLLYLLVQLLLQGHVPPSVVPRICGTSLMSLRKPTGALRSIAVGETLRRLTGKIALQLMVSRIHTILEPIQVGVREGIAHAARQWMNRRKNNPNKVMVLVDVRNSFNCVGRFADPEAVSKTVGRLVLQVSLLSGNRRQYHRQHSRSPTGDPLGPALCSLAIHTLGSQLDLLGFLPTR